MSADELASWTPITVTGVTTWALGLFTLTFDARPAFRPGQFCTVARSDVGGTCKRAYSIASAPGAPLELFVVEVEGGRLSPCLARLKPGDSLRMRPKIAGLFTLDRVPPGGTLWLVATGTGLAPYVAMLRDGALWARHDRVVLVHGVRTPGQLAYGDELAALSGSRPLTVVPVVSRAPGAGHVVGRVTTALVDGTLEAAAGCRLSSTDSHVLLCGNPSMIDEMEALLAERGLSLHTPAQPGQVHLERYW
jgi:ferredoxin--NADP+ reductase